MAQSTGAVSSSFDASRVAHLPDQEECYAVELCQSALLKVCAKGYLAAQHLLPPKPCCTADLNFSRLASA